MTHTNAICLQKEIDLLKILKWSDLHFDITLPLWTFIKIRWEGLCMIGQDHTDYLDMVLQHMQENHDARLRDWLLLMPKVVIRLKWSNLTICNLLSFEFFSFWFSLVQ